MSSESLNLAHHKTTVASVESRLLHDQLLSHGDTLLLALSGGIDSMVMLDIFTRLRQKYDLRLLVGHINHQLRDNESEEHADFVRQQAAKLGFDYLQECAPLTLEGNLQDEARQLRRSIFLKWQRQMKPRYILLGHQADDQAELLLMRLAAGCGLEGASGMSLLHEGWALRPLLGLSRADIQEYQQQCQVSYVEDSSNGKLIYRRNQLRQQLLPLLKQLQPRAVENLAAFSDTARGSLTAIDLQVEKIMQSVVSKSCADSVEIDLDLLSSQPSEVQSRLLSQLALEQGQQVLSRRQLQALLQMVCRRQGSERYILGGDLIFLREYDRATMAQSSPQSAEFTFEVDLKQTQDYCGELPFGARIVLSRRRCLNEPSQGVSLDMQRLSRALTVRSWRPGDMMKLPSSGRHRKLKRFFIDQKIPKRRRHQAVVLEDDQTIVALLNLPLGECVHVVAPGFGAQGAPCLNVWLEGN